VTDILLAPGRSPGALDIGRVFGRGFSVAVRNGVMFLSLAIVANVPDALIEISTANAIAARRPFGWLMLLRLVLNLTLSAIISGVIADAAFRALRGSPVPFRDALSRGVARFVPVIGTSFLAVLGVALGLILLVVPGLILVVRWSVAVPACVVEGFGPSASLGRSAELTAGNRWRVFAVVALFFVISLVVGLATGFAMGIVMTLVMGPPGRLIATVLTSMLTAAVGAVIYGGVFTALYYELRTAREGVDHERLADVFE
jgi:hypothetical protein